MSIQFTQEVMARQFGICLSWANLIINGRRHASLTVAKRIANFTGTNPLIWMEDGHKAERQRAILEVKLSARGKAI